jgi:hypothetical protein
MTEKEQSRRIRTEIRRVLLQVWDPIGIADEPDAQNEYDSYSGDVFTLLVNEKSDPEIVDYLVSVVRDRMGLEGTTRADMLPTLSALRSIQTK